MTRNQPTPPTFERTPDPQATGSGLLDYLSTAVLVLDRRSVIEQMNSAAEALLDTSTQAACGSALSALVAGGELLDAFDRVLDTGEPLTERALPVALDTGRTRVVDCTLTPVATADHAPKVVVELVQVDRHHQITREERLLTQIAHARNLVRRLGHEIKNPLGGLRGAAQLLQSELPDAALREYTRVIIREADRLTTLVDRMIGPRRPPRMEPVNVHEVTERVRALVNAETPASIVVERDYDPSIPDLVADPELLIQAMLNIARNAVHALGERRTHRAQNPGSAPGQHRSPPAPAHVPDRRGRRRTGHSRRPGRQHVLSRWCRDAAGARGSDFQSRSRSSTSTEGSSSAPAGRATRPSASCCRWTSRSEARVS